MRCSIQRLAAVMSAAFLCVPSLVYAQPNKIVDDIVQEAIDAYGKVSDYTAHLFRVERVGGELRKEELIFLKFRKPGSLYMKWETSPNPGLLNQETEVIYPVGKENDQMMAHLGGLINLITPTITISPTDRMVMENNRHPVTHTGIGYILNLFVQQRDKAVADKDFLQLYHGVVEIMGRKTHKVEYIIPGKGKGYYCYRAEVYFDQQNKLPIRIVVYDWDDEVVERYSFKDLQINVGLTDDDFNPRRKGYNF